MGYAFALIAVVCWGLVHIPIKLAKAPGRLGVMVAMPAAMIPLILLAVATGQFLIPDCSWRDWLFILLTGLCQFAFGEAAYYEAVHCAGITVAAPTTRLTPLLVVTATMFLTPEQFSWLLLPAAATIALGGILLARALRSRNTQPAHPDLKKGIIFALLACVAWAAGNLAVDQVDKDISRIMVTLLALGFGTLVYGTILVLTGKLTRLRTLTRRDFLLYTAVGLIGYSVAFCAFFEAIRRMGVGPAAVVCGIWPAAAVLVGILVFREPMNRLKTVGVILLVLGALLVALL